MSKYEPLYEYLSRSVQSTMRLSFAEIEKILGDNLPASAKKYPAWWANGGHIHANAWLDAGYNVENTNFNKQTVIFKRQ